MEQIKSLFEWTNLNYWLGKVYGNGKRDIIVQNDSFRDLLISTKVPFLMFFNAKQMRQYHWPGRFPGIAGNAGNQANDGKFHESHQILNQI